MSALRVLIEADGKPPVQLHVRELGVSEFRGRVDYEVALAVDEGEDEAYVMRGVKPDLAPLALAHEAITAFGLGRLERLPRDRSVPPTVPPADKATHEDMRRIENPADSAGLRPPEQ